MPILSLIAGAAVLITSWAGDGLSPSPQPREPIRVLSASHQIDFPDEIVFSLEVESAVEIAEVRFLYRLGGQDVVIYGYPDFAPALRVSADFRVATGGQSYVPSGVDVTYHYLLRDTDGNILETEERSFEYKNPAFDWQTYRQGDLIVLWHDRSPEDVAQVAADVGRQLTDVKALLGLEDVPPMKAVILNNLREAGRSFPAVSDAARRGHLYGGFAFGDLDVFVLVGLQRDGMVHEMTHLLLDEAMTSPLARVPAWLNEGLAMYFESGNAGRGNTVSAAANRGGLLPLRAMGTVPGRPQDVRLFYAQAWSLVDHMIDAHGPDRMAAFLDSLGRGTRVELALQQTYGVGLEDLEAEWKRRVTGEPPGSAATGFALVGTSAIIAGAVAIAVVAMVVRWLRTAIAPPDAPNDDL